MQNMQFAWFIYYTQIISQFSFAISGIFLFKVDKPEILKWGIWFAKAPVLSMF